MEVLGIDRQRWIIRTELRLGRVCNTRTGTFENINSSLWDVALWRMVLAAPFGGRLDEHCRA